MESGLEVIDAFVDGERVDASALKAALADAGGRDYLVDAWLLREAVQGDPSTGSVAATAAQSPRPGRLGLRPWMLAAAFAGAVIGGYAIGLRTTGQPPSSPGGSGSPAVTTTPASGAFPVPPATRVIQLEFHGSSAASGGD
jgi:hypothetical protein